MSERDSLSARKIPFMELSDASPSSLTAPPPSLPPTLTAAERAQARFTIKGNAIITGGAGTLALAAARALLEHACPALTLFDLPSTLSSSAQSIDILRHDFPAARIQTHPVDVTDPTSVTTAVADSTKAMGALDILLNFAGVVGCTHALEMTAEQWKRTLDVNTTGSFLCAQAAAQVMSSEENGKRQEEQGRRRGGSVVLTASISAHRVNFPQPQVAYNVSKAGVVAMAKSLGAEWARYGIRVNTLSPGYMDTVLNEGEGLEEARRSWAARNPMGRMGAIGELDGVVVLLCSDAGSYITGADFIVDGGATVF